PALRRQAILNLLLLRHQLLLPLLHLGVDHVLDHLFTAHRLQQFLLNTRQCLLGHRQFAALQFHHLVQRALVALLVVALQRRVRRYGKSAQAAQTGDVVAVTLAEVLLILNLPKHLLDPVAAQAGQARERFDLLFHGVLRMFCRMVRLVSSSAASPTSWRRKRSMVGASFTARSVLGSAPWL